MINYLLEYNRIYSIIGIFLILGICFFFSHNKKNINWKLILKGLLLQIVLAVFMLKTTIGYSAIYFIASGFQELYKYSHEGIAFVFGNLSEVKIGNWGFIFAIQVLPVIIFFGALMALLFYFGIIQKLVNIINRLFRPLLGTTGAETVCAIANSFLGQTEAPLLIRHYIKDLTKSEFLVVMISGMGTISGSILAVFGVMGVPVIHLLTASIMAIPATIVISKIIYPEIEESKTSCNNVEYKSNAINVFDAVSQGTSDGLWLAMNVGAMLIAFIGLLFLFNQILPVIGFIINKLFYTLGIQFQLPIITLPKLFSWLCLPFGYLLGFTGLQAEQVAELIGTKVAVNELVAYSTMLKMQLPTRMVEVVTYALCGFSNFSCIGIQIGGIGSLVPERRSWISELGIYAVLGGALANILSALIVNILI